MPTIPIRTRARVSDEPDLIDAITAIDNELVEWILHARPTNDEEKAEMRQVLLLRTQIDQKLNALVLVRMKLATTHFRAQSKRLGEISKAMQATAKSVGTVKEVLKTVGEVTTIVGSIASAVL